MIKEITFNTGTWLDYPVGKDIAAVDIQTTKTAELLRPLLRNEQYINLWCIGSSGTLISSLLAVKLITRGTYNNVRICHLRKDGEHSHQQEMIPLNGGYNLIVDNFADSGSTVLDLVDRILEEYGLEISGVVLHGSINGENVLSELTNRLQDADFIIYQK